jgi:hypothetical protein
MSRIDELKKQHPNYALSTIDIYKMISPNQTNKYVEMLIKLDKSMPRYKEEHRSEIISSMVRWGLDYNYLETFDLETLSFVFCSINNLMSPSRISAFTKFASLNERKLIENNDVTSYSSWGDIEQAVSLAEMKLIDKETAKQIKKIYEDDEWLSLRPLSLEASMKYGANTKWCTTTESGQYYARYSARGILIYNINKKTGYKVACFKNLDPNHDNEFSWWDVTDKKIEALDSEASTSVLEAIRNEIKEMPVPNQTLMTQEESNKLEAYKDGNKYRVEQPEEPRLHITGGLNYYPGSTTTNTLVLNPSDYPTTGTVSISSNTLTYNTGGNVGISNINPTTQLSITGDIAINDGDLVFRTDGVERYRYTSEGLRLPEPTQEYNHFEVRDEDTTRLIQALTRELNEGDRIAADAQQRLDDAMAEQLAAANERVAEKHLSLLDNIEIGTVDQQMIERMQRLAGIETREMRIRKTEAELEQLRAEANQDEAIDDTIYDPTKDIQTSLYEAEQPVLPSKQRKNIWDQIKSIINEL